MKCVPFALMYAYVKCFPSHAQNTLQPSCQLVKRRIMTISIKLKVLIKFGASEMMCIIESQKAMKCVPFALNVCLCEMLFLTCTEHTSTTSPVNETQDYDY